jgi:hypothetical protein
VLSLLRKGGIALLESPFEEGRRGMQRTAAIHDENRCLDSDISIFILLFVEKTYKNLIF